MLQLATDYAPQADDAQRHIVSEYTAHLADVHRAGDYQAAESSLNLPQDAAVLQAVKSLVNQKVTAQLKYHVVVGIGGSNLGTKAVYDALYGYRDVLQPQSYPKLLFAETTDPEWLVATQQLIQQLDSKHEILLSVMSKSGGTTETIANFEILAAALRQKFDDVTDRLVAITDHDSALYTAAQQQGIDCLTVPHSVGGRYSVLSPVGLFPLLSVGIAIDALLQGAAQVVDTYLSDAHNPAAQSALALAAGLGQGYVIHDSFLFHPELESVGKWYRQLLAESIGKEQSLDGAVVHTGITPTVSLGSTDLHSVGQLYLGGPRDKLTTFIAARPAMGVDMPQQRMFPDLLPMLNAKTAEDIMTAILDGVKIAYQKAELPYMQVTLDTIDEQSIGAFLQFKMLEIMYLGRLLNVNSFDQPNVEAYKIETKKILEQ
jgi:glucose-6-phosphate isomerase